LETCYAVPGNVHTQGRLTEIPRGRVKERYDSHLTGISIEEVGRGLQAKKPSLGECVDIFWNNTIQ